MKIPVLQLPNVAEHAVPTPYSEINPDFGGAALAKGVGDLEQAVGEIGQHYQREKKRAEDIARARKKEQLRQDFDRGTYGSDSQAAGDQAFGPTAEPDQATAPSPDVPEDAATQKEPVEGFDAAFEKYGLDKPDVAGGEATDQLTNGFLNTKGEQAVKEVGKQLSRLQAMRMKRAQELVGPENQRKFLDETAPLFDDVYEQFHRHTNQQIDAASLATQKGNEAMALNSIANNYDAPRAVKNQEEDIKKMLLDHALSPEDGKAKVQAWEQTVTETRLNQYVAAHNWEGAQSLFAAEKNRLGTRAEHYENLIATGRIDGEAEKIGQEAIRASSNEDGRVDPGKALAFAAERVKGGDPRLMKEARRVTEELVAHAKQAWDATAKDVSNVAYSDYNKKGWSKMDTALKEQLNKYNPELYDKLANEQARKYRESLVGLGELHRMQREANEAALKDFQSMSVEDQLNTNIDQTYGVGWGTTDLGMRTLKAEQQKAQRIADKGDAEHRNTFVQSVMDSVQSSVHGKEMEKSVRARAGVEFDKLYNEKGRVPTAKEASDAIEALQRDTVIQGFIFDSKVPQIIKDVREKKKEEAPNMPELDLTEPKSKAPPERTPPKKQVAIINTKGTVKYADPAGLDEWLAANPKWKRK